LSNYNFLAAFALIKQYASDEKMWAAVLAPGKGLQYVVRNRAGGESFRLPVAGVRTVSQT
jgi:hypothetical protein